MNKKKLFLFAIALAALFPFFTFGQVKSDSKIPTLESMIGDDGEIFETLKADTFLTEKNVLKTMFVWTSNKHDEARYPVHPDISPTLKFYHLAPPEVKFSFEGNDLKSIYISVYNRGDVGEIDESQFRRIIGEADAILSERTGVKGDEQKGKLTSRMVNYQKVWIKEPLVYIMTWSNTGRGKDFIPEYLNIVIRKFDPQSDPRRDSVTSVERRDIKKGAELVDNIVKEADGTVFIDNIPMVDQGAKGYCAVAVGERILRYFGNENLTQHALAQVAGTSDDGTQREAMIEGLKRIGVKYGVRLRDRYSWNDTVRDVEKTVSQYNRIAKKQKKNQISTVVRANVLYVADTMDQMDVDILRQLRLDDKNEYRKFQSLIHEYVNKGVPVIWCVRLGMIPEPGLHQVTGGHMRMIIGYNDTEKSLVYSDTWGVGHETKVMSLEDAWTITDAVLTLDPR